MHGSGHAIQGFENDGPRNNAISGDPERGHAAGSGDAASLDVNAGRTGAGIGRAYVLPSPTSGKASLDQVPGKWSMLRVREY